MMMKPQRRHPIVLGICTILSVWTFVTLYPAKASAHAPKEVKLSYDVASQTLQATIVHTNFSARHYIDQVEITKNGKAVTLQEYTSQPTESFVYTYKIEAVPGDVLEVKSSCNLFGSKKEKLTVGQPAASQ